MICTNILEAETSIEERTSSSCCETKTIKKGVSVNIH